MFFALPLPYTPREREVAVCLMKGRTSKEIGKTLRIRRARRMRKYQTHNTPDLVHRLVAVWAF